MGDITANFSRSEFACRCGQCGGLAEMDPVFMAQLQEARSASACGYTITSGYRCPVHPQSINRPTSSHTRGLACDIAVVTDEVRGKVLKGLYEAGFNRIGIGFEAGFIHVDADPGKNAHRLWGY